jgi:RNA polymerase subunit RPABC4/transcription elongation factor Spt4
MICRGCNADIPDGSEFCPECGMFIAGEITAGDSNIVCKKCGATIPRNSVFCPDCGETVADEKISAHKYQGKKFASVKHIINERIIAIGEEAFADCDRLEEVNLPNNVKTINKRAFANCGVMTALRLPENISEISEGVFSGCVSLKEVEIPDGVEIIKTNAFSDCVSLTRVKLPKNLRYIEAEAFSGCTSLEGVYIPDNVKEIKSGAFKNCGNPLTVLIPKEADYADDAFDKSAILLYARGEEKLQQTIDERKREEKVRIAAKKAEAERIAAEKAEAERIAAEKAEAERIAAEKAEAERIAAEKEKAEAKRLAIIQEETKERKAKNAKIITTIVISIPIIISLFVTGHPWFAVWTILGTGTVLLNVTEHDIAGILVPISGAIILIVLKVATGIIRTIVSWFS